MSPQGHSYRRLRSRPLRRRTHRYSRRQCVTLPKTVTQQYVVPTYQPMVSADLAEYSAEDIATYFAMVHRLGSTSGTALGYTGQARQERMDRQSFQIPNIQAPWVTSLIKSPPPVPRASPYQVAPAEPPIKAAPPRSKRPPVLKNSSRCSLHEGITIPQDARELRITTLSQVPKAAVYPTQWVTCRHHIWHEGITGLPSVRGRWGRLLGPTCPV